MAVKTTKFSTNSPQNTSKTFESETEIFKEKYILPEKMTENY